MVSKAKIALIAAIAAVGMATPALADGVLGSPNSGAAQSRQTVVHARKLYDSATAPNYDAQSSNNSDWANDAQWSTTGRQNSGH